MSYYSHTKSTPSCFYLLALLFILSFLSCSALASGSSRSPLPVVPLRLQTEAKNNDTTNGANDNSREWSWWNSFFSAFSMIFVSEILDKTFLISAVMSMKNPRIIIFLASVLALALMTVISVAMGVFLFTIIPVLYTKIISAILFLIFGIVMLVEGFNKKRMAAKEELKEICSEIETAEAAVISRDSSQQGESHDAHVVLIPVELDSAHSTDEHKASTSVDNFSQDHMKRIDASLSRAIKDPDDDRGSSSPSLASIQAHSTPALDSDRLLSSTPRSRNLSTAELPVVLPSGFVGRLKYMGRKLFSPAFIQTFGLCFLAEWGDRSQIATIALAASKNIYGVTMGAIFGHLVCTAIAVVAGRIIAYKISVRTVTILGGIVFLVFCIISIIEI